MFASEAPAAELMWLHDLPAGVHPTAFSVRLATHFKPEASGEHLFSLVSAGLTRLYVNNQLVIDNWTKHNVVENSASGHRAYVLGERIRRRTCVNDVE